jgi:hypothetical protein
MFSDCPALTLEANFLAKNSKFPFGGRYRATPCLSRFGSAAFMIPEIVDYLRDLAQTCTRLARGCPHLATSHGLEEIAIDLMTKARVLEDFKQ